MSSDNTEPFPDFAPLEAGQLSASSASGAARPTNPHPSHGRASRFFPRASAQAEGFASGSGDVRGQGTGRGPLGPPPSMSESHSGHPGTSASRVPGTSASRFPGGGHYELESYRNVVRSQFAPHGEVEHLESRLREKSEECAWYRRQLADSQRDRHNADRAVESLRLALQGKDERIRILQEQVDGRRSLMFGIRGQGAGANTGAPINRYAASPAADQLGGVTGPSSPDLGPSGLQLSSMPMGMDIGRALDDIFDDARRWALQHAPFRGGQVTDVPERLQSVLQRLTEPTYYMLLLWDPHRRWALITKVIVSYIVNEVLACDLLLGFRDDWDRLLAHSKEARRDGRQYTDSAKRAFFFRFAELVRDFLHEPGALNFLRAKFEAACEHLYTLLTPLMWWDTQPGPARVSLAAIISIAFRMHLAMYSAPVEWHFDHPPVAAAFNARVHTSRDEVASSFADAAAPAAPVAPVPVVGNRIRLAITPVVIKRDHNAQTLLVSTVRRSDVLLMP